jgi:transporter family-2 protein
MTWLLLLPVALAAGMTLPTQFAINSQLRQVVGGPVLAAALSFLVGTVVLFAATAVVRRSVPELGPIMNAPWWMWLGGLLGLSSCALRSFSPPASGQQRRWACSWPGK